MEGEHPGLELTFSEVDVGAGVQLGRRETQDWDLNRQLHKHRAEELRVGMGPWDGEGQCA